MFHSCWFQVRNTMKPALLVALIVAICSVLGGHNFSIEGKLRDTNCFLSQKTTEILGDSKSLQKLSIKKLNQLNFKILFKGCHDHNFFLFCSSKTYLPLSFFPLHKINLYFALPSNLTSSLLLLNIFRSHKKIIFWKHNSFFIPVWMCQHTKKHYNPVPFSKNYDLAMFSHLALTKKVGILHYRKDNLSS